MAKVLSDKTKKKVKDIIYQKADDYGYASCGRIDSGIFLDQLVEDPEVGLVLREYMPDSRIRTYIKDGVLNAYTKALKKMALSSTTPEQTIKTLYKKEAITIQECKGKNAGVTVLRSEDGEIFVVSEGTVLKWETALRKALELIANEEGLTINEKTPSICIKLAPVGAALTRSDQNHIRTALKAIGVLVQFCDH